MTGKNSNFFRRVYEVVGRIPEGQVMTYGQIAEILSTKDARVVGFALHANRDEKIPCHRVVNKDGRLAPNFGFGGLKEQRQRLLAENVPFKDDNHVDLEKSLWVLK